MVIYIAGEINGDANYRQKFGQKEREFTEAGYKVLNPAVQHAGLSNADYMRVCFAMMEAADVVYFLRDWERSAGAQLEFMWCKYVGKAVMLEMEGE